MTELKPFLLCPAAKDYLWGGTRLNDDFARTIPVKPLAETWVCSTHPDGPSIVDSGPYRGQTLTQLIEARPEVLGSHPASGFELPILVKFIDAKQNLSVQVHPSDDYASRFEHGQSGKTEMWYVLDADHDSEIIYGFSRNVSKETVREAIKIGKVENYLNRVKIHKNDVFYVESGTVHGIGAGALIAEVQQNSNLTYRLYDYDRVDKTGAKRLLHIDKALDVANLKSSAEPRQPMRVLRYKNGCASELLCRCKYFEVSRFLVNTEIHRKLVAFHADGLSFRVLLCIGGCGTFLWNDGSALNFFKGDCLFVPANSECFKIHAKAQFLDIRG